MDDNGAELMRTDLSKVADMDFCYLTTTGRVSGRPYTIEIWFALNGNTLYVLSGRGADADWVKNLVRVPEVAVRIDKQHFTGQGRIVKQADEDTLARRLLVAKYQPRDSDDLTEWGQTALPVAVDLESLEE